VRTVAVLLDDERRDSAMGVVAFAIKNSPTGCCRWVTRQPLIYVVVQQRPTANSG